jgi:hypothetical protein
MQKDHATSEIETATQWSVCEVEQSNSEHAKKGGALHLLRIPIPEHDQEAPVQERLRQS